MKYKDLIIRILFRFIPNKIVRKYSYHKEYRKLMNSDLGVFLKANAVLKNSYKGKRCFILGNGPSLAGVNLFLLKDEVTFTVNDLYYHEDFDKINTTYHLFADPFYFKDLEATIKKLLEKSNPKTIFLDRSACKTILSNSLHKKYPISVYANGMEVEDMSFIPIDLCKMLPYFCTVVQSAIAIAVYMGFEEIYLLGCDCTGIINYIERMHGEEMSEYAFHLPKEDQKQQQSVMITSEHIFYEWHHIFKSYRILRTQLEQKNIKLVNLTGSSILDSLEKGNLEDVIQSK